MSRRCDEAGFNLIEVIVALGLIAGALISIAGLLVMGGHQLDRGRDSSQATAVARDVMEEMRGWGFGRLFDRFAGNCNPASPCQSRTESIATAWQARIEEALGPDAHAEIVLEPLSATGAPTGETLAQAVRITVKVRWLERLEPRELTLVAVEM